MEHMRDLVMAMPFKPGETPLRVVPNLEKTLFDYYYRGAYDDWWAQDCNDFSAHFARHADIPGTYSGGWFDPFAIATTTTNYFTAMSKQNSMPQRLIMGPWPTWARATRCPGRAKSTSGLTPSGVFRASILTSNAGSTAG